MQGARFKVVRVSMLWVAKLFARVSRAIGLAHVDKMQAGVSRGGKQMCTQLECKAWNTEETADAEIEREAPAADKVCGRNLE